MVDSGLENDLMAPRKKPVLIQVELESALTRFRAWCERARAAPRSRKMDLSPTTATRYAEGVRGFMPHAGTTAPIHEQARAFADWLAYEATARHAAHP